ncbi:MAG: hypothetical protein PVJ86_04920 [Phycisphaerales bacterium]
MSRCWCRFGMAVLVVVFAWLPFSWAKIVLTVLGVLLAGAALIGTCCCTTMAQPKEKPENKDTEKASE